MRGNAEEHTLLAPGTLAGVLDLLATAPGEWLPIAGGTELMVAHAAGRLNAKKLVSLWGVEELRFVRTTPDSVAIGAGTTFSDVRADNSVVEEFPLLARAAGWIGSIANQTRATLGGNLVNGSPAADSSPALLVYDAELELISTRGARRVTYAQFHTGYKQSVLAADELLYSIHLPRRFTRHRQYIRKVGTRRAMAIAKVALAATALVQNGVFHEIRLAAASLGPFPMRLRQTESALLGRSIASDVLLAAQQALMAEAQPIDDIRSTAEYRRRVAANLLHECLLDLGCTGKPQ